MGWTHVQRRSGPKGFPKLVDERTMTFAVRRGNRQYISSGHRSADDRACLFIMDDTPGAPDLRCTPAPSSWRSTLTQS